MENLIQDYIRKSYRFLQRKTKNVPKYSLFGKTQKSIIRDVPLVGGLSPTNSMDFGRNCMQLVAQALRKGDIEHLLSRRIKEKLKEANKDPIPNSMYVKVRDLEQTQVVITSL